MAKNKNSNEKINFIDVRKRLNILTFFSIIAVSFFIIFVFLYGYFQIKNENNKLVNEKKTHIYNLYLGDLFQRLLLLVNSTPFVDYLYSGDFTRLKLDSEMLNNFNHYVNKEIIGYNLTDMKLKNIIFVGRKSDFNLDLDLCYLNNKLDYSKGRCVSKLTVYFEKELIFNKIKKIEPLLKECFDCVPFTLSFGQVINGFLVTNTSNFKIKYDLEIKNYTKTMNFVIFSFLFIIAIIFFTFYLNHKFLNIYIYYPLNELFKYVKNNTHIKKSSFVLNEINEIAHTIDDFKNISEKNHEINKQIELSRLATQVAHDIKSPLLALNMFFVKINSQLPEDNRVLVRNAIQRIQDIANSLILKHQEEYLNRNINMNSQISEPFSVQLLSSLINSLISEKRLQYREYFKIQIEDKLDSNSYGLFSKIQPKKFKIILSNLINNSIESIIDMGIINLKLYSNENQIFFSIEDNGKGIPSNILPKLMERGATFGKVDGSGLGLYHAKMVAEEWGAYLTIQSQVGKGTSVTLALPKFSPPAWFVSRLNIKINSTIIIIDDDVSIHNTWDDRLKNEIFSEHNINIIHFTNPNDLILWHNERLNLKCLEIIYLCDYEFINSNMNGIQLIDKLKIQENSILVTSRDEDNGFIQSCENQNIKLIPKSLVCFVPISINECSCTDIILIDDDYFTYKLWNSSSKNKNIIYFENPLEFLSEINNYDNKTPIYIDSCLGNGIKGEEIALELFNKGFKEIYLTTNYSPEKFPFMSWIKAIIGKSPPW